MNAQTFDFYQIADPLLKWYRSCARDLPWRRTRDPYRIWVSEIMLQQTRVEAVKPYYERFLKAFPDVNSLAGSGEELFKLWEGLGYYSRARNLRAGAKQIEAYGFPQSYEGLLKIKGIGPYTAAAVASIAFGIPAAAVDGNVLRVVSRLCCLEDDPAEPSVRREIFTLLSSSMPAGFDSEKIDRFGLPLNNAGDFNQGMMELGATVCLPNGKPLCKSCPLAGQCLANASDAAQSFPLKAPKKARRIEDRLVLVAKSGDRYGIRRRGESGLLAGLWEFPSETAGETDEEQLAKWSEQFGLNVVRTESLGTAKHIFTHIEWRMRGVLAECESAGERNGAEKLLFVTPEELEREYAFPTALSAYKKRISEFQKSLFDK